MTRPTLQPVPEERHLLRVGVGAGAITLLIYLTLPLTQFLAKELETPVVLTPVDYVEPPPKPIAEDIPPMDEPPPAEPPPDLDQPPPDKPSLAALQVNLNIGPSYASQAFNLTGFGVAPDPSQELVFSLQDLDGTPRCIRPGRLVYPPELKRFQLNGEVRLLVLIRKDGSVKALEVDKSAHPSFDRAAIKAAETSLYETPLKDGQPVAVRFYLPVRFEFQ